jgi:enoyl-CoA hydratase
MSYTNILIDDPAPSVRRITLNRPEKRNALNATLRREILAAVQAHDADPDVKVTIIRGAGPCFSAGYDLSADAQDYSTPLPYHVAVGWGRTRVR